MTLRGWLGVIVVALAVGVVGWIGTAVVWDLYQDHQRVHAIWELELRRAQAQAAQGAAGS